MKINNITQLQAMQSVRKFTAPPPKAFKDKKKYSRKGKWSKND
jgi:hypothetical protein